MPAPVAVPAPIPMVEPPQSPLTAAKEQWAAAATTSSFEEQNTATAAETIDELSRGGDDSRSNSLENSQSIGLGGPMPMATSYIDTFSDLDPLGTGKSKPYVDKKYFFQDLKNPPKKVLNDLSERDTVFSTTFPLGESSSARASADIFEDSNSSDLGKPNESNGISGVEFTAHFPPAEVFNSNSATVNNSISNNKSDSFASETVKSKTEDRIIGNNKALLVSDNDPFSPRVKKFDPFDADCVRSPMDPFEFSYSSKEGKPKQTILPDTRIDDVKLDGDRKNPNVFNGPLQVSLPPESCSSYVNQQKRLERHTSDANETSSVRHRPNVFKQNTVDVISSIRKPNLFGKNFSKRESNSINMRRLQESDSMSENEAAPEPPPRPDSHTQAEPPPLPPKKQFSEIVIRPRVTSPLAREPLKYDYLSGQKKNQASNDTPALPLPSRRVGRTETAYPGPGRPAKKTTKEDDYYLTPITSVPVLLPPPQMKGSIKNRGRRSESGTLSNIDTKSSADETRSRQTPSPAAPNTATIPDITLSQLLTLGIDDLALKLNVPVSKLNTMTIVELTKYLSDFIEKTSQKNVPAAIESNKQKSPTPIKKASEAAVFKVSFDDSSDATFVARFDDNFGEDSSFTPNFANFNEKADSTVDRYAAFREIIDEDSKNFDTPELSGLQMTDQVENIVGDLPEPTPVVTKIDTKITQAISQAKDRYAALRDIILVEDLFDKPMPMANDANAMLFDSPIAENPPTQIELAEEAASPNLDDDARSSPEVNISINLEEDFSERTKTDATPTISQAFVTCRDDTEIDEYMNRALSNLSLDSRDHLSPLSSKSPVAKSQNASTSPIQIQHTARKSPLAAAPLSSLESIQKAILNDMSTSPMSISKSPLSKSPLSKSPLTRSPLSKSPLSKSPLNKSPLSRSPIIDGSVSTPKSPNIQTLDEIAQSNMDALLNRSPKPDKTPESTSAEVGRGMNNCLLDHYYNDYTHRKYAL